jgi:hypothetical protein
VARLEWQKQGVIALGPDMDDVADVPPETLVSCRLEPIASHLRENGIPLGPEIWYRFHFETMRQRDRPQVPAVVVAQARGDRMRAAHRAASRPSRAPVHFPARCQPVYDGIVEVLERECCCRRVYIPDIIDRLRNILQAIPRSRFFRFVQVFVAKLVPPGDL